MRARLISSNSSLHSAQSPRFPAPAFPRSQPQSGVIFERCSPLSPCPLQVSVLLALRGCGKFCVTLQAVSVTLLLMPPGAMSLKIQVVFLFFFSVENVQVNWFPGSRDGFFFVASKFNSEMQAMFNYRPVENDMWPHSKHSDHFSHHTSTVTWSERKLNKTGTASVLMPHYDWYENIFSTSGLLLPWVIVLTGRIFSLAFRASDSTGVMLIGFVTKMIIECLEWCTYHFRQVDNWYVAEVRHIAERTSKFEGE